MATTIIDKSKPLPPKFDINTWLKRKPDDKALRLEKDRFWDKEREYWHNGYKDIPARHYAYMTLGSLKTIDGTTIKPRWRDWDEKIILLGDEAIKKSQHEIIVKRREFGLSSFYGGFMPIFNALINPGSTALLTSADAGRVAGLFNEKALVMYFGLDKYIRPGRISQRQNGYLHLGTLDRITGDIGGLNSKVKCRETADTDESAKAFESERAMYIFLDELFMHPRADRVLKSSLACMRQGFDMVGHMVLGGSCGEMTKTGAETGERLWSSAAELDMQTIFIPGYACIERADELDDSGNKTGKKINFCVNGHTDEKAATDWILKTREKLKKAKDQSFYSSFVVQYPLTPDEVFNAHTAGVFDEDIYDKLRASSIKIKNGEFVEGRYDIIADNGRVHARPNNTGKYYLTFPPDGGGEYIAGCDPIPFGTSNIDKGSDFTFIVKDRLRERYVGYYAVRSLNADMVIDDCILLQELYRSNKYPNGAICNPEMNMGAVLLEKYKQKGKLYLLSDRLTHLGIAYETKQAAKGWYNNNKTGERANNYMIQYLRKYGDQIGIERLVKELNKFPNENLDLVDAMRSCEMLDAELVEKYKVVYVPPKRQKVRVVSKDSFGRTIVKWV